MDDPAKFKLTRRTLITTGLGGLVGTALLTGGAGAGSAREPVKLWRLDPEWGYPITTDSGSDTKSRCKGRACHSAAPHRYFLTEADALAARLHPCCLAQPTPVFAKVDLNSLMPFYTAAHGGIDTRGVGIPAEISMALGDSTTTTPTTTTPTSTTTTPTSTRPTTTLPSPQPDPDGVAAANPASDDSDVGSVLAMTGTSAAVATLGGAAAVAIGASLCLAATDDTPNKNEQPRS